MKVEIDKRILIAGAIFFALVLIITSGIFINRLGVLKAQKQAWKDEVADSKRKIKTLKSEINIKKIENEQLDREIAAHKVHVDSLMQVVETREEKILQIKKYGQQTIDDYLALPLNEREAVFAKLIGR